MYRSVAIYGEDVWQIDVNLAIVETKDEADSLSSNGVGRASFVTYLGRPALAIEVEGSLQHFYDSDIEITEISEKKQAVMGRPLDVSDPDQLAKVVESLESRDPAYIVEASDMVSSNLRLADFLARYGEGYQPDNIAYGSTPHTQETCRHVIGFIGFYKLRDISDPAIADHIAQCQRFNQLTKRFQVIHPGHTQFIAYCIDCGAKNDSKGNEAAFQDLLTKMGGFDASP